MGCPDDRAASPVTGDKRIDSPAARTRARVSVFEQLCRKFHTSPAILCCIRAHLTFGSPSSERSAAGWAARRRARPCSSAFSHASTWSLPLRPTSRIGLSAPVPAPAEMADLGNLDEIEN